MARVKSVNNLRKRNRLIAKLTADGIGGGIDALTESDRSIVTAARAVPDPHPVVSEQPLDVPGGIMGGGFYYYPNPVADLRDRFMPGEPLNFAPLRDNLPRFLGKSAAEIFEHLLRSQRAATGEPMATVDVAEFFDGNGDRGSIAPNVVDDAGGPSFELFRDTLLAIASRAEVAAVGVEIGEIPNPAHPGDDDMWPAAERIFVWTTAPLKTVRGWVKPLCPDEVARGHLKAVAPPDGEAIPPNVKVYEVFWD